MVEDYPRQNLRKKSWHRERPRRLRQFCCESDSESARDIRLTGGRCGCSGDLGANVCSPPQVIEICGAQIRHARVAARRTGNVCEMPGYSETGFITFQNHPIKRGCAALRG